MSSAERQQTDHQDEPATMRTARAMIQAGYRPIPIHPGKKNPMGLDWGLIRHLPEKWRDPRIGLGVLLGDLGDGRGLIDFEIDDEERARPVLARLFPDGITDTLTFRSNKGPHYFFLYDLRLAAYGQTIIKGEINKQGKLEGNPNYLGVEFRIGTIDSSKPVQEQSVIPPTLKDDGEAREWIDRGGETLEPWTPFLRSGLFLPLPDSVFADLDRYAHATDEEAGEAVWDIEDVKRAILPHSLELAKEWGLRVVGGRETLKGFLLCRAIDREDADPSAGFNPTTGVYTDRKTSRDLSLFQLAIALNAFPDIWTAVNRLGERFGVKPRAGKNKRTSESFEGSGGSEGRSQSNEPEPWRPPRLFDPLPAVPFPLEVFPAGLAELCQVGAASFQCPVDYFGACLLALAGAAVGMSVNLVVKNGYVVAAHLYIAVVGPPGSKKSPVVRFLAAVFYLIDQELRDSYRLDKATYDEDHREYEANKKKGVPADPPEAPVRGQLTLDDATREAVALIHSENPRGLVLIKDELIGWVRAMNAYRPGGKGDDQQFWLSVNSGELVKVDRKTGTREPIIVPHPCVTIIGGLTPSRLPDVRGGGDDGWIDRILFAYPEPLPAEDWTELEVPEDFREDWARAVRKIWSRRMVPDPSGRPRPYFVHLSDAARPLWADFINDHRRETRHQDFPAALHGPWSKLEGFTARMALILCQLHQAFDPTDDRLPRDVEPLDIWGARKLADYFKAHFRRARNELMRPGGEVPDDAAAIVRWLRKSRRPSFSERDAKLNFTGRFARDPIALADALDWLVRRGCIRPLKLEDRKVGRPHSGIFEVNPFLYGVSEDDFSPE